MLVLPRKINESIFVIGPAGDFFKMKLVGANRNYATLEFDLCGGKFEPSFLVDPKGLASLQKGTGRWSVKHKPSGKSFDLMVDKVVSKAEGFDRLQRPSYAKIGLEDKTGTFQFYREEMWSRIPKGQKCKITKGQK
jgi:hypothetical protein